MTCGYQHNLGFGFNTALGVKVANPDKAVISIKAMAAFYSACRIWPLPCSIVSMSWPSCSTTPASATCVATRSGATAAIDRRGGTFHEPTVLTDVTTGFDWLTSDTQLAQEYLQLGATFVAAGIDTTLLAGSARRLAQ